MKNKLFQECMCLRWLQCQEHGQKLKAMVVLWFLLLMGTSLHANQLPFLPAKKVDATEQSKRITVKGHVTDRQDENLIGVSIKIQGTNEGTITDIDGNFSVQANVGQTLRFSYVGYKDYEVVVQQSFLNVVMEEDAQALDEVVVIGYGTARKKDLTGAIANIRPATLKAEMPRNMHDLLRANAAGLNIAVNNEAKGGGDFLIRGKGTLKAGSQPLLVVDGVIFGGELADLNPNDIVSIDVLKDASSAAVYGAKAANGVIAITTQKGVAGSKPVINVNSSWGIVTPIKSRKVRNAEQFLAFRQAYEIGRQNEDFLAQYPEIYTDPRKLQGVDQLDWYNYDQGEPVTSVTERDLLTKWLSRLELTNPEIENYFNGNLTNWQDLLLNNALQQNYNVSISKKGEDYQYYWSLGYMDNEGIKDGDEFTRFTTRLNLESNITKYLTVGMNMNFSSRDESAIAVDTKALTWFSPFCSNEVDNPESAYQHYPNGLATIANPFYDRKYTDQKKLYMNLEGTIYGRLDLPYGFSYQMNFSPRLSWSEDFQHHSAKNDAWVGEGGSSYRQHGKTFNWQVDNVFSWKYEFLKKHRVEATFLVNAEKNQSWKTKASNKGYNPSDALGYHGIQLGTNPTVLSTDQYTTGDALMGRIFYSYDNKYMLTASIRRDGYSAFGVMNPRATFPAVAVSWVFTEEDFMKKASSWLSYGKLRFSWGENGNRDIGVYAALAELTSNPTCWIDENGNYYITTYTLNQKMPNSKLKWERASSYNIGLDFGLFGDILSGSIDFYQKMTNDLLMDRSIPPITGFSKVLSNMGQLQNRGMELTLNANIMKRKNFAWTASGTFSLNRREIKHLYGNMEDILDEEGNVIGQKEADDITNKWFIGEDPDRIWDYVGDGVWQVDEAEEAAVYGCSPGDFKYLDLNEDGQYSNDDKRHQKYTTPRFRWSLRNNFTLFNDIDVSFMLYSLWGHYGSYADAANNNFDPAISCGYEQPYWTPENPINDYARIGSVNKGTHYVNKSFIRLDNITISYHLPQRWSKVVGIQDLRLNASVHNVAVFAPHYDGWDPEANNPMGRTFNFGINFTL